MSHPHATQSRLQPFVLAGALAALITTHAAADVVSFSETTFDPGSWTALEPFWSLPPTGGSMHVVSDRFSGGNPVNDFMVQMFTVDFPQGDFNVIRAPIMMTGFVYNPSVQGTILSIGASIHTFAAFENLPPHLGAPRVYIEQNGRLYGAKGSGNFHSFSFDDPAHTWNFADYLAADFYEIIPNVGLDLESNPDFGGAEMRFGFGLSLTSTGLDGAGQTFIGGGFDDVTIHLNVVPAPGAAVLLGLAGCIGAGRRRRG